MNADFLNKLFIYDKATGILTRRIKRGTCHHVGQIVGYINVPKNHPYPYLMTRIKGKLRYIHRIVWLMREGWLPKMIDHINRNKSDNFIENLREVTQSENSKNVNKRMINMCDKIIQYNIDNKFIKEWDSVNDIIKEHPKYNRDFVISCCVKRKKTENGYI